MSEQEYNEKISKLLKVFVNRSYSSNSEKNNQDQEIIDTCIKLWRLDYNCEVIDNSSGVICQSYPSSIILPLYELQHNNESNPDPSPIMMGSQLNATAENISADDGLPIFDSAVPFASSSDCPNINTNEQRLDNVSHSSSQSEQNNLQSHLRDVSIARCRSRVPFPVILCKGKYIARSGTLSCSADVYLKWLVQLATYPKKTETETRESKETSNSLLDVETVRNADMQLLKLFDISHIIDLMVEDKKRKYYLNVSSSEKADSKERYSKFRIASLPYPGCEFFTNFTKNHLSSKFLQIDWSSSINNAALSLPDGFHGLIPSFVTKEWENYKSWSLRDLTLNYLNYMLEYITNRYSEDKGFLIHCISGWDRTPLFISLLRLTLWADGFIHTSLNATQILYFTLAYDWYLFGHQLSTRIGQRENIMYFCFEFLDLMVKTEYCRIGCQCADSELIENLEEAANTDSDNQSIFDSTTSVDFIANKSQLNFPQQSISKILSSSPITCEAELADSFFDKENDCYFKDLPGNKFTTTVKSGLTVTAFTVTSEVDVSDRNIISQSRSPLKEINIDSPVKRYRNTSGEEFCARTSSISPVTSSPSGSEKRGSRSSSAFKKTNMNVNLKELSARKSRKYSNSEDPARLNVSTDLINADAADVPGNSDSEIGTKGVPSVSNPVQVPGTRLRHDSIASSTDSWLKVYLSDTLDDHNSSRTSLDPCNEDGKNNEDANSTAHEFSFASSTGSSNDGTNLSSRGIKLKAVRKKFYKLYGETPASQSEQSGVVGTFSDMVQKIAP